MLKLIKFCIVGASSTVISVGILKSLLILAPNVPWWVCQAIGFVFGVINGFYWNRRWTFAAQDQGSVKRQFPKFLASNLIGLVLNLLITKGFLVAFTGTVHHQANPESNTVVLASICAIPIVVIWNFGASRFWTFRTPKTQSPVSQAPTN